MTQRKGSSHEDLASHQARAFDPSQPAHLSADDGQLERLAIQMRMRKGMGAMTADNRTNEQLSGISGQFTDEQVEAAAKAIWDIDDSQVLDPPWDQLDEKFKRHYRTLARAALVAAAEVAPEVQRVSESDALALVEDVIAIHADRIGTHYEDCYKYHVACLAVAVKHRLGGDGRGDRETD